MDVQKILNDYAIIAKELGNDSACYLLNEFREKNLNQRYELPLIGQFSSGKSATINHLLGRDLLPTKRVETTAFATFIFYSESEYATLQFSDGHIEYITLEEVKLLDNTKVVEEGKQIKALNIGLNSDLLKSGLTFVDTPGVNTIITTHLEITERILESAQCIVYVIAKNLTDEDVLMIQTIEMKNIPVIFVRTHIDDMKSTEENWEATVRENENNIAGLLGHPVKFFAISNLTDRHEFDSNFENLKKHVSEEIASDVKKVFEEAIIERLEPIKKELETSILFKQQNLSQTAGKSIEEIEKQKSQIEILMTSWNDKLLAQQKQIQKKVNETKEDVSLRIQSMVDSSIKDFNVVANNSDGKTESLNLAMNDYLIKTSSAMNATVERLIQMGADSLCNKLGEEMQTVNSELSAIGLVGDCNFDMSVVRDYAERQKNIDNEFLAKEAQINAIKEKLSHQANLSQQQKVELTTAIAQAEKEIDVYKANVESTLNSYEPHYVQKQSQLGKIGKSIGNILDLAMLFIPGSGWAKAGKFVSEIGKSGSLVRKAGEVLSKSAKVLEKTDTAKDAATFLGGLKNVNDKIQGKLKKTSVFDYFSLSYWFEKVGEKFDPASCDLDLQYEQQFQNNVQKVKSELQDALEKRRAMIENLAILNGNEWKTKQEMAAADQMSKDLSREIEAIKSKLESERKKAVRDSLVSQAKQEMENRINDYAEMLIKRSLAMIDTVFSSIVNSADLKITNQLTSLSQQLSEISTNRNEYVMNRDQQQEHYADMILKLKIS